MQPLQVRASEIMRSYPERSEEDTTVVLQPVAAEADEAKSGYEELQEKKKSKKENEDLISDL